MSNIWLLLLSRVRLHRPRWFVPFVAVFVAGLIIAGLIYAYAIYQAVNERSHTPYVHAHSTH